MLLCGVRIVFVYSYLPTESDSPNSSSPSLSPLFALPICNCYCCPGGQALELLLIATLVTRV